MSRNGVCPVAEPPQCGQRDDGQPHTDADGDLTGQDVVHPATGEQLDGGGLSGAGGFRLRSLLT
jgi:hypothetical protein